MMSIRSQLHFPTCLLVAALGLVFSVREARALSQPRTFIQNATGECQSALPVFDGQIRKRPLALRNEGTAPAFVSCSLMMTGESIDGAKLIEVLAGNSTSSEIELTCTLITGVSIFEPRQFLPKTIIAPANAQGLLFWAPSDNGGNNFDNNSINLSCALPVGISLSAILVTFDEDIGA